VRIETLVRDSSDLTGLAAAARESVIARQAELGPEFSEVDVTPVLNWGGFVNRSFHVVAGARRLQRDRLRLWARATLLDWVIDPLSDWVGAASEPEQGAAIRAANEVVHANALGLYLELYG
jgi:hypothetical protein